MWAINQLGFSDFERRASETLRRHSRPVVCERLRELENSVCTHCQGAWRRGVGTPIASSSCDVSSQPAHPSPATCSSSARRSAGSERDGEPTAASATHSDHSMKPRRGHLGNCRGPRHVDRVRPPVLGERVDQELEQQVYGRPRPRRKRLKNTRAPSKSSRGGNARSMA